MSMDFVYDLTEKLEEEEIDYFLITIRSGKKKDIADVFFRLKDEQSVESLIKTLYKFAESAEEELLEPKKDTRDNAKDSKKSKKPKNRKTIENH